MDHDLSCTFNYLISVGYYMPSALNGKTTPISSDIFSTVHFKRYLISYGSLVPQIRMTIKMCHFLAGKLKFIPAPLVLTILPNVRTEL